MSTLTNLQSNIIPQFATSMPYTLKLLCILVLQYPHSTLKHMEDNLNQHMKQFVGNNTGIYENSQNNTTSEETTTTTCKQKEFNPLHVMIPMILTALIIIIVYLYPLIFAKRQHKYLHLHIISITIFFFAFANIVIVMLDFDIAVSTYLSLLSSVHIVHSIQTTMQTQLSTNLLVGQELIANVLAIWKYFILFAVWVLEPRFLKQDFINYLYILYTSLLPEIIGSLSLFIFIPFLQK